MTLDPTNRLGYNRDYESIKNHSFFKGINFKNMKDLEPQYKKFLKFKFSLKNKTSFNEDIPVEKKIEMIIKEGIIFKKSSHRSHFKPQKLLVYNTSKIEYIHPSKNVTKVLLL